MIYYITSVCPARSTLSDVRPKHARKSLCLEMKFDIIKQHQGDEGANSIGCAFMT